ncbi:hypothetical protein N8729_01120 [Candidatus Pelagibacter sp.]|nr:hypothetical protein [Candidatus Pelagibacter sp.]
MENKIIFFSIDRLGDYLIRSNVIKEISKNFQHSEIICSEKNYKLISTQNFFSNVVIFNNKFKFFNKLKFFFLYLFSKYDASIVFDGKNISTLLIFIIRSNFKFVFIYKKKGFINYIARKVLIFFFKMFNIKYEYLNSRKLIEENNYDNYPEKYKILNKYFVINNTYTYFIDDSFVDKYKHLYGKYITIHLDEKFDDIKNITTNFQNSIINLQKRTNKLIFLTSFQNKFNYYKKLNFPRLDLIDLENSSYVYSNINIIEDLPILNFQNLIKNSFINISCHAGYLVHTSLAFKKKTIDIMNESEQVWLNTWVKKTDNYKIIYKSAINNKIDIEDILEKINNEFI